MPMDESIYKNNILKLSILLSFMLHFLAIQLIHFKPIKPFQNKLSQIEVILTNSKDNYQTDADVLAQSNSDKGGNTEKDVHKKSPLPIVTENKNPASEIYELTDQEQRVLEFIGEGMTNREIAKNMFLAEKTVKNYVSSLLRKLGLERRTQAAAMAVRLSVGRS